MSFDDGGNFVRIKALADVAFEVFVFVDDLVELLEGVVLLHGGKVVRDEEVGLEVLGHHFVSEFLKRIQSQGLQLKLLLLRRDAEVVFAHLVVLLLVDVEFGHVGLSAQDS